jgi:hypothetical protein
MVSQTRVANMSGNPNNGFRVSDNRNNDKNVYSPRTSGGKKKRRVCGVLVICPRAHHHTMVYRPKRILTQEGLGLLMGL